MSYVMFIGGLKFGTPADDRDSKLQNLSASDICIIFDSIDTYSYSHSNEITSYPVESRSTVSDHVFSPNSKFTFTGRITSSPFIVRSQVEWDKNTDKNSPKNSNRHQAAYDVLKTARDSRQKTTLNTEETVLVDYVITGLDIVRDSPNEVLTVNITMEEMRTVTVGKTVLALNVGDGLKTSSEGNKNKGAVSADPKGGAEGQVKTTTNLNPATDGIYKSLGDAGYKGFYRPEGETGWKFDPNS